MRLMLVLAAASLFAGISAPMRADETERIAKPTAPFAVKLTGKGKPIIFIPGLACSGEVWDSAVEHYKNHNECHVLTLAGFAGQPALKDKSAYLETIRKGIVAYIKEKKLEKPVVVGHSLGGYLVFSLAASDPDLFGPVMAVDTLPCICAAMGRKTDAESLKQQSERTEKRLVEMSRDAFLKDQKGFFGGWFTDKDKLEKVYSWISASDQATVARAMGEFMGGDLRTELGRIKSPILCVIAYDKDLEQSGMKQSDLEKECTEQIAKAPHHKLVVTADAKHFIMYDQPKWLWEQMDEFLKEAGK